MFPTNNKDKENYTPTNSSQIEGTNYDFNHKILTVRFKTGTYEYYQVPVEKWEGLKKAESAGKYINSDIKPNYEYKKVS